MSTTAEPGADLAPAAGELGQLCGVGLLVLPTLDPCQSATPRLGRALWTASGTAQWNGGPQLPLIENDLENDWDGVGLELDLPDSPAKQMSTMLRAWPMFMPPRSPTTGAWVRGAARRLDRVVTTSWIGDADDLSGLRGGGRHHVPGSAGHHGHGDPDLRPERCLLVAPVPDPGSLHILESADNPAADRRECGRLELPGEGAARASRSRYATAIRPTC